MVQMLKKEGLLREFGLITWFIPYRIGAHKVPFEKTGRSSSYIGSDFNPGVLVSLRCRLESNLLVM